MLVTAHWSATGPDRLRDYHVEFALKDPSVASQFDLKALLQEDVRRIPWEAIRAHFDIYKNVELDTPTDYGTWHLNHDPRDQSANIEVGALCMGGESVSVAGSWGAHPYTYAHFLMHVGIVARICALKKIDANESFDASEYGLQNGPIYSVSNHAERAIQTPDKDASLRPGFGYFIYSGDPDCRWDQSVPDQSLSHLLATPEGAKTTALQTASTFRNLVHQVKAVGFSDYWGLDGAIN